MGQPQRVGEWCATAGGQVTQDAVWYYPEPKPDAKAVRDRVAFWKGVKIEV